MPPTRESYPFDQECSICHTPISAGMEHTHLSVGDRHPRTAELCDPCARITLPVWNLYGPGPDADAGELSIAESLQMTAIAMLDRNRRERHVGRRLLRRCGWTRRTIRLFHRLRRRLRGAMDLFVVDTAPETTMECLTCGTPADGPRGLIACEEGMAVVCRDCLDVLIPFVDDGWMDEGELPEPGMLMLWAQRFEPEQADRIRRSRILRTLRPGRHVAVLLTDGAQPESSSPSRALVGMHQSLDVHQLKKQLLHVSVHLLSRVPGKKTVPRNECLRG